MTLISSKKCELPVIVPTKKPLHFAGVFYYINYEWLEGRLAIADNSDEMISKICEIIEKAIDNINYMPAAAKRKLNSLLRVLKRE